MGLCMKTTVEIDDALLRQAKETGVREGKSLKALIEDGLRQLLERRVRYEQGKSPRLQLPVSSAGGGLQPGVILNDAAQLEDVMNS
jgi:hypothetical protein